MATSELARGVIIRLGSALIVGLLSAFSAVSWADCGPQQKEVCGGVCCGNDSAPPPSPRDYAGENGNALNDQGLLAYRNRDWSNAIGYYRQALQYKPYDAVIRNNLGVAINELGIEAWHGGRVIEAIKYYQEAVKNSPNDAMIKSNLDKATAELARQQEVARAEERELRQKIEDNKILANKIQTELANFSLESGEANPTGKPGLGYGPSVGDGFNTHKSHPVPLAFGSPSENMSEKARSQFDRIGGTIEAARQKSATEKARINSDPRMIKIDQEIGQLKIQKNTLNREIEVLKSDMGATADPKRKQELTIKLDKKLQEEKAKVSVIAQQEESKKKMHHTIQVERDAK